MVLNEKGIRMGKKNFVLCLCLPAMIFIFGMRITAAAEPFELVAETYPPYEYMENGKITGLSVEILEEAAEMADIGIHIGFYPWKRAMMMAETGKADGIFSMAYSKEREKFVLFPSQPLVVSKNRIFANSDFKGDIANIRDLAGKRIGVVRGNIYGEAFDRCKACVKDVASNVDELFRAFGAKRYSLIIGDEDVVFHLAKRLGLKEIRPLSYVSAELKYYLGISRKSERTEELSDKISDALLRMKNSGRLEAIQNKYR